MKMLLPGCFLFLCSCSQSPSGKSIAGADAIAQTKQQLLSLERKWLEAEFALDTAYISTLIDSTFMGISAGHISNKQQEVDNIYKNISAMRKDSIFLDSLKLEEAIVSLYDNVAVVTFITHTYKKDKGRPTEKRMRFYDVWIKRSNDWKAVSSQGTLLSK